MASLRQLLRRAKDRVRRFFVWPVATERRRLAITALLTAAVFAYVGRQLVLVQLRPDTGKVFHPKNYTRKLPAVRGQISDRHGNPLSVSASRWKLSLDAVALAEVAPLSRTNELLQVYTNLLALNVCPPDRLRQTIRLAITEPRPRNKPLGETEDTEVIRAIRGNWLLRACVGQENLSRRVYLGGRDFAHIVGVVNSREEPQCGIELFFDDKLRGFGGEIVGKRTAGGRELRGRRDKRVNAVNGCTVVLTVDQALQRIVCEALDDAMDEYKPDAAWAIVEDVATGEILAIASRPDFEPEEYFRLAQSNSPRLWNSAVFQAYEPGSVMKAIIAAAALQEGLVATNSILDVSDTLYCGRRLKDHRGLPNRITVTDMIALSSNRGASRLAMLLGKARTESFLRAFGFGSRTGIQMREEGTGILRPHRKWSDLQGIRIAIGQGVSVTGIQLVNAYACIANGGRLLRPSIVKEIVTASNEVVWRHEPEEIGRPIGAKVARDMTFMLSQVVKPGGTARRAAVPGYGVAGKTGTAQIAEHGHYSEQDFCASFCGFLPARDPSLAILVTVKRPQETERNPEGRHTGGSVAAPIFARIAAAAADYLLIPTDKEAAAPPPSPTTTDEEPDDVIPFEDLPPDEEA